jgi:hypothetical protein
VLLPTSSSPVRPVFCGINPKGDQPQRGLRGVKKHDNRHPAKEQVGGVLQYERKNEYVPDGAQSQNPHKDSAWPVTCYFSHNKTPFVV